MPSCSTQLPTARTAYKTVCLDNSATYHLFHESLGLEMCDWAKISACSLISNLCFLRASWSFSKSVKTTSRLYFLRMLYFQWTILATVPYSVSNIIPALMPLRVLPHTHTPPPGHYMHCSCYDMRDSSCPLALPPGGTRGPPCTRWNLWEAYIQWSQSWFVRPLRRWVMHRRNSRGAF